MLPSWLLCTYLKYTHVKSLLKMFIWVKDQRHNVTGKRMLKEKEKSLCAFMCLKNNIPCIWNTLFYMFNLVGPYSGIYRIYWFILTDECNTKTHSVMYWKELVIPRSPVLLKPTRHLVTTFIYFHTFLKNYIEIHLCLRVWRDQITVCILPLSHWYSEHLHNNNCLT